MADDIIERLRADDLIYNRGPNYEPLRVPASELRREAAAEISTLGADLAAARAEIAELRGMASEYEPDLTAAYLAGFEPGKKTGRELAFEDAARIIEQNQIVETPIGPAIEPRWDGNRAGLAYAEAIRKRIRRRP